MPRTTAVDALIGARLKRRRTLRGISVAELARLSGLTYQQELGEAHPTAYTLWSGTAIDLYFTLGGVLFLFAAIVYRRVRRRRWPARYGSGSRPA